MNRGMRRHRGHRVRLQLTSRHDGKGSPQFSQIGGVIGRIALQHARHTGPSSGTDNIDRQDAHAGANTNRRTPLAQASRRDWRFGMRDSMDTESLVFERADECVKELSDRFPQYLCLCEERSVYQAKPSGAGLQFCM